MDGGERIGHAAKPERREHERGGPSLGARVQQLDLVVAETDVAALDEQLTRLGGRERELVRAQLGERATGTQPRQAERGSMRVSTIRRAFAGRCSTA